MTDRESRREPMTSIHDIFDQELEAEQRRRQDLPAASSAADLTPGSSGASSASRRAGRQGGATDDLPRQPDPAPDGPSEEHRPRRSGRHSGPADGESSGVPVRQRPADSVTPDRPGEPPTPDSALDQERHDEGELPRDVHALTARGSSGVTWFGVILLGLGVGYLAANVVSGDPAWISEASWLGAAAAILVGLICLFWVRAESSMRWAGNLLAVLAWTMTVVTAVQFGLVAMVSGGRVPAPGPMSGNALLAMAILWFGAWLIARLDSRRVRKVVQRMSADIGAAGAAGERLRAFERRLRELDERLADLDERTQRTADEQESLREVAATWEARQAEVAREAAAAREAAEAKEAPPQSRVSRSLFRRDR